MASRIAMTICAVWIVVSAMAFTFFGLSSTSAAANKSQIVSQIVLSQKNTIVLDSGVDKESIDRLLSDYSRAIRSLSENEPIYLVLNSQGGDVPEGFRFLSYATASRREIKTLTIYAASTAFHIMQKLDERLILQKGVVMGHRMRVENLSGEIPGNFNRLLEEYMKDADQFDSVIARRMGLSLESYRDLSRVGYRAIGSQAVRENAADRVVTARCDKTLTGTSTITYTDEQGVQRIRVRNNCPLLANF